MKKYVFTFAFISCALFVYAQNGFAYTNFEGGCVTCHPKEGVHTHADANDSSKCISCHTASSGGKDVKPEKCAACHPTGNVGSCNLVKAHNSQSCLSCHEDKNIVSEVCSSGSCPAAAVLGDEDPRLGTLRKFRDTVLAKSALGKRLIKTYYNNADSINAALEKNPTLKAFSYKALQSFIPVAEIFM